MKQTIISNSYEETQKLGADFIKKIGDRRILGLYGDLGSGKTTFIQGLAKGLGIQKKIISPSFIIMRSYKIPITNNQLPITAFYHVDLYRINNEKDIQELGLLEIMQDPANIVAIEWPEKIKKSLSPQTISLSFKYLDENRREIIIM